MTKVLSEFSSFSNYGVKASAGQDAGTRNTDTKQTGTGRSESQTQRLMSVQVSHRHKIHRTVARSLPTHTDPRRRGQVRWNTKTQAIHRQCATNRHRQPHTWSLTLRMLSVQLARQAANQSSQFAYQPASQPTRRQPASEFASQPPASHNQSACQAPASQFASQPATCSSQEPSG